MRIGSRKIGKNQRCFLIAEIGQAHDGSGKLAHAYVDAAAEAGADAVKFQTHIAKHESTRAEPFRVKHSPKDTSRYAYWERMEFSSSRWKSLARHAREKGLIFLSSPFSEPAVDLLKKLNMPAWKIGSGETASGLLLKYILKNTSGPILLSTGMSKWHEIDAAANEIRKAKRPFAIFHCVSEYPTPLPRAGLNLLATYQSKYRVPIGLSDHSGKVYPALAAIALGVSLVEIHLILDRSEQGPDASSSLTKKEFRKVREFADAWQILRSNPISKATLAQKAAPLRKKFGKSLALRKFCPSGTILTPDHLCFKKPGTGIPPESKGKVVGKTLRNSKQPDELLCWRDFQ